MSTPITPNTPHDSPTSDAPPHPASQLGQFSPGTVVAGKYRIQKVVGDGGVALLLAATHLGLDDGISIKLLKPEFAHDPETVARFMAEARARFKINNKHVARVLDVDTLADGAPFVVMERAEGRDLRSILKEEGDLPIERAVDLTLQVCEALAASHAVQIIVRDITPQNLFVTDAVDAEYVKLIDSGFSELDLARQQPTTRKTRTTNVGLGTLAYMSPEQVRASNRLDAKADQWSLGCVLYELLTGVSPFERTSQMQTCAAILEDEPVPLRACCPGAFLELEQALTRCLRKDPRDRYADIAELALAIAPFGARSVGSAPRCVELLAAAGRRSPRVLDRSSPTPDSKQPVEGGESGCIALTEADLVEAEELFSVQPTKSRKQRLVLLALGALTTLSAAYLAALGWDAVQSAPAPVTHRAYDSPDFRAVPVANNGGAPRAPEPERAPTPTAAPATAKRDVRPIAPAATFKPSLPAPKRRRSDDSPKEPDVGF